jgi:putative transposase
MKKIRLQKEIYNQKNHPCLITICTKDKCNIFGNNPFTDYCLSLLKDLSNKHKIKLYAYTFMPDHIHLIISVQGDKSIIDFVKRFKGNSTQKSHQFGLEGRIFQNRFHDHFIRKEDGLNKTIMYVLNNPVRKGLVDNWEDFPYSGYNM